MSLASQLHSATPEVHLEEKHKKRYVQGTTRNGCTSLVEEEVKKKELVSIIDV